MKLSTNRKLLNLTKKGGYVRLSFVSALREVLVTKPEEFDPRKLLGPGREAIKQTVQSKMKLFGSSGKANEI